MMTRMALPLLLGLMAASASASTECTITVPASPGALHSVPDLLQAELVADRVADVIICLAPGVHSLLGQPLTLSAEHSSASRSVSWRGPGAVVSGGVTLSGWQVVSKTSTGTLYSVGAPASVQALPTVRQLWVNGVRANRTTQNPASLSLTPTNTGYLAATAPAWLDPAVVEMMWVSQIRNWVAPRCTVAGVSGTNITVQPKCFEHLVQRGTVAPPPAPNALIENVGLPTNPGEFYYYSSKKTLYYMAAPSFDISTAEFVTPVQETLLTGSQLASHTWSDITFSYSTWFAPNTPDGYVTTQTGVHSCATGTCEPVGTVSFSASTHLTFSNCSFTKHGAQYALSLTDASSFVTVDSSSFADLSGGAVKLANVDNTRAVSKNPADFDTDYSVTRSTTFDTSKEYFGCATVFAGYVRNAVIGNNTISEAGYSGVSLGWGWGNVFSFAQNNSVEFNYVEGVMTRLKDGGGIYTLGAQPGSRVHGNFVTGDDNIFAVLYHDNGSQGFNNTQNVVDRSPLAWAFFLQGCCNLPALDIYVQDIWYRSTAAPRNNCKATNCVVDQPTIHDLTSSEPFPAAAQAIIDGAGANPTKLW